MTPPTMTEAQLTAAILDALSRSGLGLFWRCNTGKLQDSRGRWVSFGLGDGTPDIVGILRVPVCAPVDRFGLPRWTDGRYMIGRFIGLEVKTEDGKVREEQAAWHCVARKHGALVVVVRSVREALDAVGAP